MHFAENITRQISPVKNAMIAKINGRLFGPLRRPCEQRIYLPHFIALCRLLFETVYSLLRILVTIRFGGALTFFFRNCGSYMLTPRTSFKTAEAVLSRLNAAPHNYWSIVRSHIPRRGRSGPIVPKIFRQIGCRLNPIPHFSPPRSGGEKQIKGSF